MRLDALNLGHLRRAIQLFNAESYLGDPPPAQVKFAGDDARPLRDVLPQFIDESAKNGSGARSYALRLGNRRYPFMKLKLSEHLLKGEYFFMIDSHDQMFQEHVDPALCQLKDFNRGLKCKIEAAWEGAGLPTTVNLRGLVEGTPVPKEPRKNQRILLVDDDLAIQDTVAMLLEHRGYDVDRADDGQEAVARADAKRHALILMDVEMPHVSGVEACAMLKDDPARQRIPILLATAGAVELAQQAAPNGYLIKPFQAEALFRFLDALLGGGEPGPGGASGASGAVGSS